jgi:hypothetical protein
MLVLMMLEGIDDAYQESPVASGFRHLRDIERNTDCVRPGLISRTRNRARVRLDKWREMAIICGISRSVISPVVL